MVPAQVQRVCRSWRIVEMMYSCFRDEQVTGLTNRLNGKLNKQVSSLIKMSIGDWIYFVESHVTWWGYILKNCTFRLLCHCANIITCAYRPSDSYGQQPAGWYVAKIPVLGRLRQEALKFKASLGYITRLSQKKKKKQEKYSNVTRRQSLMEPHCCMRGTPLTGPFCTRLYTQYGMSL
jgi:hypothetical protein